MNEACLTCLSNAGERRISPGPTIHAGRHWFVEHAYPVRQPGWLVLVLKRHAAALHDLTADEFAELGSLLGQTVRVLHAALGSAKEYASCFAEAEGFQHVHVHVFARPTGWPGELFGPRSFALLKDVDDRPELRAEIRALCEQLRAAWETD